MFVVGSPLVFHVNIFSITAQNSRTNTLVVYKIQGMLCARLRASIKNARKRRLNISKNDCTHDHLLGCMPCNPRRIVPSNPEAVMKMVDITNQIVK